MVTWTKAETLWTRKEDRFIRVTGLFTNEGTGGTKAVCFTSALVCSKGRSVIKRKKEDIEQRSTREQASPGKLLYVPSDAKLFFPVGWLWGQCHRKKRRQTQNATCAALILGNILYNNSKFLCRYAKTYHCECNDSISLSNLLIKINYDAHGTCVCKK